MRDGVHCTSCPIGVSWVEVDSVVYSGLPMPSPRIPHRTDISNNLEVVWFALVTCQWIFQMEIVWSCTNYLCQVPSLREREETTREYTRRG